MWLVVLNKTLRRIHSLDLNFDLNKLNMKIMKWLKEEFTKTPGYMRVNISLLTILMISSVSSTVLQISRMGENTSDANTFGSLELLKVKNEK